MEPFQRLCGLPLLQALLPAELRSRQEKPQVCIPADLRQVAVRSFQDQHTGIRQLLFRQEAVTGTVVPPEPGGAVFFPGPDRFADQPFRVAVSPGNGKPLLRFLRMRDHKIVRVKHVCVKSFCQAGSQGGLSRRAGPVNGYKQPPVSAPFLFDLPGCLPENHIHRFYRSNERPAFSSA